MWKIEKIVRKGDYDYAVMKTHPSATTYGYVLHHRVVVENHLGRLLNSNEVVHHKNGIKQDNRIENLKVMIIGEHERLHGLKKGKIMADLICPWCKVSFSVPYNKTHVIKKRGLYTTCSKSCRGKFSRRVQLHGLTTEMENAISGNIVRVYKQYITDNPEGTLDNRDTVETIRIPPEMVKR